MKQGDFTHSRSRPMTPIGRGPSTRASSRGPLPIPSRVEGYHLFTTAVGQQGMGGAIGKRGESAPEKMRTYIHVDSVDSALQKVTELGGSVIEPKSEVPGQGWYGTFRDTEGNEHAVWESLPEGSPNGRHRPA